MLTVAVVTPIKGQHTGACRLEIASCPAGWFGQEYCHSATRIVRTEVQGNKSPAAMAGILFSLPAVPHEGQKR